MYGILDDARDAVRVLWRSPAYCVTAAGTLAVGIAINVAMFSVLNVVFFRPAPYTAADQLFNLTMSTRPGQLSTGPVRTATLGEVQGVLAAFGEAAGFREANFIVRSEQRRRLRRLPVCSRIRRCLGCCELRRSWGVVSERKMRERAPRRRQW